MTVLFGVHGLSATLTAEAARGLLERMGARAEVASVPLRSTPVTSFSAVDGIACGSCSRVFPGDTAPAAFVQRPGLWLAMQGQLDNRAELASLLGLQAGFEGSSGPEPMSDAALSLAAYERFGIDCVEHLLGEWAFVLWDARHQRLLLARDATGHSALFWWKGNGHLLFASSLPTLLASGPVPTRPDGRWLAGLLTVFTDPAYPGATAFEDVHAVPPGHLMIAQGGRLNLQRWWWPEKLEPLDDLPLPELEARFLALYDDAVRCSLRRRSGSVALMMSAGLDSGSVAALAAPMLAQQGQRLNAYVHRPRFNSPDAYASRTSDEWPLALTTAGFIGNVDAVSCTTERTSPIDGIHRWLDMAAAPSHAAANWYWLLDIAQRAEDDGASVLLTGQAGNSTVSFNGTGDLLPMLRRGGLRKVTGLLRADRSGWLAAVRDRLVKPMLRPAWHAARRSWDEATRQTAGWHDFGPLLPSFAEHLKLDESMRQAGHDASFALPSARVRQLFRLSLMGGADNGLAVWSELGKAHGLTVRDPTRDRRLVELCWRLPDEIFWRQGQGRGLIRHGMRDRLPREVLECSRKGLQSSDLRARLQDCRAELDGAVDAVCRHEVARQWVDTARLEQIARAMFKGDETDRGVLPDAHLLRALAAGLFVVRHA